MTTFTLATPARFRYLPTVLSHGWCVLQPFAYDEARATLTRIQRLSTGEVVKLAITAHDETSLAITVEGADPISAARDEIATVVARCLGFDQAVERFYAVAREKPGYTWIEENGAGRMLVSPTVWEDLVKTLFTTNTTWAMTKGMNARFVTLGEPYSGGGHAFPTPEQTAALSPEALNEHVRAGYRGDYLHALAVAIAEGHLNPEAWRDPALPSTEVYKALKAIKGFGDYAAGAMMRLLWRFDALGLDSVCRTMFRTKINNGVPATDKEIAAYYEHFGEWRGLAVWMDVIRDDFTPSGDQPTY